MLVVETPGDAVDNGDRHRRLLSPSAKCVNAAAAERTVAAVMPSPGCLLHRSRVAEALQAAGTCSLPTNHRGAAAPPAGRLAGRPRQPIRVVGIISIHDGSCDDDE